MNADFFSAALSEVVAPSASVDAAKVWRRFIAYLADWILLELAASLFRNIGFDWLSQLGPRGIVIGFSMGALYFASMECRIGNGQTLGKRLLKVRVAGADGRPISFERALVRYTIFAIPVFLYGWKLPETRTSWIISALIFLVVLWIGGSNLYLIMFDRQNRQGLHDLAVRSYVIYADHEGPVNGKPIPQLHWVILASLLVAITSGVYFVEDWSERQPAPMEFHRDVAVLERMDGVQRASLRDRLMHGLSGGTRKIVYINVVRNTEAANQESIASDAARMLLRSDPNLQTYDLINVRLFNGYDIGISSRWKHVEFEQSPAAWRGASTQ